MVAYVSQSIEGVNVLTSFAPISASTPDVPGFPFAVGTKVVCTDDSEWVFVIAGTVTGIAQYDAVGIDIAFTALPTLGGATFEMTKKQIGWYQGATTLVTGAGAWVMVSGFPTIHVLASAAKAVQLYTTDTSGYLDDAIATGSQYPIRGVYLTTTVGATNTQQTASAPFPTIGPMTALV